MNKVSANIGKDIFVLPSRIGEDVFAALQVNSKVSFEVANAAPAVDLTHWGGVVRLVPSHNGTLQPTGVD